MERYRLIERLGGPGGYVHSEIFESRSHALARMAGLRDDAVASGVAGVDGERHHVIATGSLSRSEANVLLEGGRVLSWYIEDLEDESGFDY